ncbi:MAG: DUF262 domain-containing HNH endonuclease family protein [Turicibacter sp.]|nr:DUF262 domain-containing HNH endonuclease family protein [Turicibacter sp.]
MSLKADSPSILSFFRDKDVDQYKIPKYQRAYSWTDQVNEFCDDLIDLDASNKEDYFFGAIITTSDQQNQRIKQVTDGQQRITTFVILIKHLYNLCSETIDDIKSKQNERGSKIKLKKLEEKLSEKKSDLAQSIVKNGNYKLVLSKVDEEFFKLLLNSIDDYNFSFYCNDIINEIDSNKKDSNNDAELNQYLKGIKKSTSDLPTIPTTILFNTLQEKYFTKFNKLNSYEYKKCKIKLMKKYIISNYEKVKSLMCNFEQEYGLTDTINLKEYLYFPKEINSVSHQRLLKASEVISDKIISIFVNEEDLCLRAEHLEKFIELFLEKTSIVTISSNNIDSAYTMFQVLNDRGRPLAVIDLLRPYTMQLVENDFDESDVIKLGSYWDELSTKSYCEAYLKDYLSSYKNVAAREKKLHNRYKEYFFNKDKSSLEIYDEVVKIRETEKIYSKIIEGNWPYERPRANNFQRARLKHIITSLEYKGAIPLLLTIYDIGQEKDFIDAIDVIERVVFRYVTVCDERANKVTSIYNETIQLSRENDSFDIIKFKAKMKGLLDDPACSLDIFKEKLVKSKKMEYSSNNIKILKYFLSTLEIYSSDYKTNPEKDILDNPIKSMIINDNITIEHIYPQSAVCKCDTMEEVKHKIGNLTLLALDENIANSNKLFEDKKDGYKNEQIHITRMLTEYNEWNIANYKKQTDFYINIACKVYNLADN